MERIQLDPGVQFPSHLGLGSSSLKSLTKVIDRNVEDQYLHRGGWGPWIEFGSKRQPWGFGLVVENPLTRLAIYGGAAEGG